MRVFFIWQLQDGKSWGWSRRTWTFGRSFQLSGSQPYSKSPHFIPLSCWFQWGRISIQFKTSIGFLWRFNEPVSYIRLALYNLYFYFIIAQCVTKILVRILIIEIIGIRWATNGSNRIWNKEGVNINLLMSIALLKFENIDSSILL